MGRQLVICNMSRFACRQWLGRCEQQMQHYRKCAPLMMLLHRALKTLQACFTATSRLNCRVLGCIPPVSAQDGTSPVSQDRR